MSDEQPTTPVGGYTFGKEQFILEVEHGLKGLERDTPYGARADEVGKSADGVGKKAEETGSVEGYVSKQKRGLARFMGKRI
jgi:hypothetical protein